MQSLARSSQQIKTNPGLAIAVIYITVTFQPFFRVTISSIRSCSQNADTGRNLLTNLWTLVVGIEWAPGRQQLKPFRRLSLKIFVGI